jgi:hypothetical protein
MPLVVTLYFFLGAVFGLTFIVWGYAALQPDAKGSMVRFRLLLFPACLILWPYLGFRWLASRRPTDE